MSRVVLVTGVSRYLACRLAGRLAADPAIDRIIGVDTVPPARASWITGRGVHRPKAPPNSSGAILSRPRRRRS